jgi:malonyl-CoA O-methyltransferase
VPLHCEYLPATGAPRQDLVLLHGWGCNREVWRPLLVFLRPWANITLLDLPGCAPGSGETLQLTGLLSAILDCSPRQAVYVGWSLGGQLAIELAAQYPERVVALVTLCSNPLFVAANDWPGMDEEGFHQFVGAVQTDPAAALKRFNTLQVAGSRHPRALLRMLQSLSHESASRELLVGLGWLQTLDQRESLSQLTQPQLHLLGEMDALVPVSVSQLIASVTADKALAHLKVLPAACHLAPLDVPEILEREIHAFLDQVGTVTASPPVAVEVEKKAVAASFSRAATGYDSVARLQRDVGERLLDYLDAWSGDPENMLDLGCGTGYFCSALRDRFPRAHYLGLDLAGGMVDFARRRNASDCEWLVADAESLPLASESVDLVFSSLAVQWCYRLEHLFAELSRVLSPGGWCVFTSLGPHTLSELRSAWATVDSHQHVNTFVPTADLVAAAQRVPGMELTLENRSYCMDYRRVRDLLDELKALGAHNMNRSRPPGLASRKALQGMLQAYEAQRTNGVLPATYDVIFGVLKKR